MGLLPDEKTFYRRCLTLVLPSISISLCLPSPCLLCLPQCALPLCPLSLPLCAVTPSLCPSLRDPSSASPLRGSLRALWGRRVLTPNLKKQALALGFSLFLCHVDPFSALFCICLEKLNLFLCCFATVWHLLSSCLYRFASQTALDRAHNPTVYAVLGALASSGPSWSTVGLPWGSLGVSWVHVVLLPRPCHVLACFTLRIFAWLGSRYWGCL